ncbi:NADP-dependent oxidoreductase [Sphingobium sp. Sx8-8]|uniref:NADP-dependent oxidoreductase n=1 Tax=Sphingobium sp. Sx8-8 TaxID=2933617 RepID=UPI001F56FEB1|nr:NADP-dependent oxidoreductase [Sphingobium sp. Sx8-8]
MAVNRRFTLVSRPDGAPRPSDFRLVEEAVPVIGEGECLIRNHYISIDPAIRTWLNQEDTYMPAIAVGDALRASTLGVVEASNHPRLKVGDWVQGLNRIEDYSVCGPDGANGRVDVSRVPSPSAFLSVAGGTGLTAWFAVEEELQPKAGQMLLVSGAAGAVGSIIGQLARGRGARVVGIAGGPAKCARLVERYGYDAAVDYKGKDVDALRAAIAQACPDGVDLLFENVGGICLDAALLNINQGGLVVVCGLISEYNGEPYGTRQLIRLLMHSVAMRGYVLPKYAARLGEGRKALIDLVARGELVYDEHVEEGMENVLPAFMRLFDGSNEGKMVVKLV